MFISRYGSLTALRDAAIGVLKQKCWFVVVAKVWASSLPRAESGVFHVERSEKARVYWVHTFSVIRAIVAILAVHRISNLLNPRWPLPL
jgi:hypothetical protein